MTLFNLFCTFFYVGLFTVGGGLVAITLMYKPIVESGLLSPETFYNMVAISESTPGPIGINMATYVGYNQFGIIGGIVTTFAEVLPSAIIVLVIAKFFMRFHKQPLVQAAFLGLRPAVTGMIAVAAVQVLLISVLSISKVTENGVWYSLFNVRESIFYVVALVLLGTTKLHPIAVVAAGAVFGIVFL
jgi:chromate transporter